jgi:hypothetical protein
MLLRKFFVTMVVPILVLFASLQNAQEDPEILISLNKNIKMACKWSTSENVAADFNVSVYPPSTRDLNAYLEQPSTLTQSNPSILFAANIKGYDDKWASEKIIQWTIPDEHPGQDRKNCLNILKKTTTGSVDKFYDAPKRQMRNFYMLSSKEAFVHPTGMIGLSCGYYIGLESCENRFSHIPGDWGWENKCVPYLRTEEGSRAWETLWKDVGSKVDGVTMENQTLLDEYCRYREDRSTPKERTIFPRKYKKMFVMPALWDYNYHHFVADSLARGAHHYKFLRDNEDVMIHIREFEKHSHISGVDPLTLLGLRRMRENLLTMLGIDMSRVVSGPLLAEEVYIPRPTACSNTLLNPFQIRILAKQLLKGAHRLARPERFHPIHGAPDANSSTANSSTANSSTTRLLSDVLRGNVSELDMSQRNLQSSNADLGAVKVHKKVMIIQQRHHDSYSNDRQWTNETFDRVVNAFQQRFPNHHIIRMSNNCEKYGTCCPACDIIKYSHADVLVGAHGAGLTNQMFMPPNSLVVEIVGDFKDVSMPVCGYYGTLAAVMGNHHYIYAYVQSNNRFMRRQINDTEKAVYKFNPEDAAAGALSLYQRIHQDEQ